MIPRHPPDRKRWTPSVAPGKSIIRGLLPTVILLVFSGCRHNAPPVRPPGDGTVRQFVILFAATDWGPQGREADDPTSRNAVWLQTVRLAAAAESWLPRQLTVLYQDGTAPDDEPSSSMALRPATAKNLEQALREAGSRMDGDDHLLLHLSVHGEPSGVLECDNGDALTSRRLSAMLAPCPADRTLLIVDACFAGAAIAGITAPAVRIGTAPAENYGWIERDFSFGQYFFQACPTPSDMTAVRAAFSDAQAAFRAAGEARLPSLRSSYGGEGLAPHYLDKLSFEAVMIGP